MSWRQINEEIRRCRALPTAEARIKCLMQLFARRHDGMVAFALGKELWACGNLRDALQYFEIAERLFPLDRYKTRARQAKLQVKSELEKTKEYVEVPTMLGLIKLKEIKLGNYNLETTLFVVACTKTKIWDIYSDAPEFLPAQYAYLGESFSKFITWLNALPSFERNNIKWLILSAKYGYIEPWHPICNYDVTFEDESTGPISDETLYRQVMYQTRWSGISLRGFNTVICCGSRVYVDKVRYSFKDLDCQIIHCVP